MMASVLLEEEEILDLLILRETQRVGEREREGHVRGRNQEKGAHQNPNVLPP